MSKGPEHQRFPVAGCIAAVIVACAACFLFLFRSSSKASQEAALEMSSLYLRELTAQTINHFETSLKSQFSQLRTVAEALNTEEDLSSPEALTAFLERAQKNNGLSFLALLDDRGYYHSAKGSFPSASKISFLGDLLRGETDLASYDETISGDDMILLGSRIEPVSYGGTTYLAILAGLGTDFISTQLSLEKEDAQTYSNIVSKTGNYIIRSNDNTDLPAGTNFLSMIQKYAVFDPGYSLKTVQADFRNGEAGIVSCVLGTQRQYLYYAPIPETDWFMLTIIPYEVVDDTVSGLTRQLNQNAVIMLAVIVLLLSAVFFYNYISLNRSASALRAANASAEEARRKAENANMAKSEFLSRMSHEIRTPMNGIIGMSVIALQNVENPARVEDCLKKVSLSSKHLLSLINDVLDMSKIESGKVEIRHEAFDFRVFLEGLGNIYYSQSKAKNIAYETVLLGPVAETLAGDSLRLNQILSNLLSNALKFTPAGGSIRLRVSEQSRGEGRVWLRFEVIDTGCGIAENNFEKIFESFEQENADVTSRYGGTGLGLSIVRRFTELMGGSVSVTSKPGCGSTFTAVLPFGLAKEQEPAVCYENLRALVADDDRDTCEHVTSLLRKMQIHADWADNGFSAVSQAEAAHSRGEDYNVCFVDWKMPDMDGLETARRIRRIVGDGISTLLITACDVNEIEYEAREAGAAGVISKPLFESTLAEALVNIRQEHPFYDSQSSRPADYDFRGRHILLAEDNELNREIAIELISATGAVVDTAEDGIQGVEMFTRSLPGHYDLILMDIQMPRMDGYEATQKIRRLDRPDARTVPIFAMTANAFAEDEIRSREAGMNAHISKPLDVKALYTQMNLILTDLQ